MKHKKKWAILIAILLLPSFVYLGLTTGKHHFDRLPIVDSLFLESDHNNALVFKNIKQILANRISIIHFLGKFNNESRNVSLNGLKKLYEKYHRYPDFQMVSFIVGNKKEIIEELSSVSTSFSEDKWHFVSMIENEILLLNEQLNLFNTLNKNYYSPYFFIIDKDIHVRAGYPESHPNEPFKYNGNDVSMLKKMVDDIQVLLAEYSMELKKNNKYKM